jgi:hypothetical protein
MRNKALAPAGNLTDVPSYAVRSPQSAGLVAEDAIRLRAYEKWEAAGKPAGDGVQFWLAAERELWQQRPRTRTWWTHVRPWIVPRRLRFFRREDKQPT